MAKEFNKECKSEDKEFRMSIFPSDNPTARLNFKIIPKNRGLIVTKTKEEDYVTIEIISKPQFPSHPLPNQAKYNLL